MTEQTCLTYTVSEAATLLGLSKSTAYTMCRSNPPVFPGCLRLGKRFLISKYQFDAYLKGTDEQTKAGENG